MTSPLHPAPVTHPQFMAAAAGNDMASLRRYLEQGGNVDLVNDAGESALLVATRAGNEAFLVELLKAEPALGLDWKGSAIEIAVKTGRADLAAHIYRAAVARARPVTIDEVLVAIDLADMQVVRRYLVQGGKVDEEQSYPSPLYRACIAGRHAIAALLCAAGANPLAKKDRPASADANPFVSTSTPSPLSAAARRGDATMVQIMLDSQRRDGDPPAGSTTPVVDSARFERIRSIRDASSEALHVAVRAHQPGALTQLLDAAGPLTAHAVTLLALAALDAWAEDESAAAATLRIVLQRTDLAQRTRLRDRDGSTLLHHAASVNSGWGIDVLVGEGIPVDFAEPTVDQGATPFLIACKHGSLAAIRRLVAHGATVGLRTANGKDALAVAIEQWDPEQDGLLLDNAPLQDVVACLLELGCDPDAPDGAGITARMRAANRPELLNLMDAYAARKAIRNTLSAAGALPARLSR